MERAREEMYKSDESKVRSQVNWMETGSNCGGKEMCRNTLCSTVCTASIGKDRELEFWGKSSHLNVLSLQLFLLGCLHFSFS